MKMKWILSLVAIATFGCSSPEPVLYPNAHLTNQGPAAAKSDVADCKEMAEAHGASGDKGAGTDVATSTAVGGGAGAATGAVGGAIVGSAGTGAAVGAATGATAGLIRGLLKSGEPTAVHKKFVEKCLRDRGYEPIGWE